MTNESAVRLRGDEFSRLYEARSDFDIVEEDLLDPAVLEPLGIAAGSAAHEALLGWQRLLRVHPEESAAAALHGAGLRSANAIARVPREHFVAEFGDRLAGMAEQIHDRASAIAAKTAHAFADLAGLLSPQVRGAPFNNAAPGLAAELRKLPSYEDLFGSADFLGCPDCASIFGPAAYFTDLMRIIDRYITDPASGNEIPPGMKLEERRPDLFDELELDCAATNDPVTYLALVNEILAATVDPANPADAPRALATAQYPFNAPFNLPLVQIRQALRQLGTSLEQTWSAFPVPAHAGKARALAGTKLTLDAAASDRDEAYTWMRAVVATGTEAGQYRTILAYDGAAREATLDAAFSPSPGRTPDILVQDALDPARETLGVNRELLAILLAPPADPATLSAQYGVPDIRAYLPRAGAGTLSATAGSTTATLAGATFSAADLGSQLLIGDQLRTVVKLDANPAHATVDVAWAADASGAYEIFPYIGLDRGEAFIGRAGLNQDQLAALLRQGLSSAEVADGGASQFYVNGPGSGPPMSLVLDQRDPANTVERITNLSLDRLDRLSRFTRLAAACGIGYADLDWAMRLSGAQDKITPAALESLALLARTAARTGLTVRTAAAYLGNLKTTGRGDGPARADPFDVIYNNPALLAGHDPYAPDSTTPFDPARPPTWAYEQHDAANETLRKRLGAALALGDDDLTALARYSAHLEGESVPSTLVLDLPVLSRFYRVATAASLARLTVRELLALIRAMGCPPPDRLDVLGLVLGTASWIAAGPLNLDDVTFAVTAADATPDQLREIRSLIASLAGLAASAAVTAEAFLSPTIDAEESAALAKKLTEDGMLKAGIVGDVRLDHALATALFPFAADAFVSELIDLPASQAVIDALARHVPPYLSGTAAQRRGRRPRAKAIPAPVYFLTTDYEPNSDLEFLFPKDDLLRAQKIASVRAVLSAVRASIAGVLSTLAGARDTQESIAVEGLARFLALDARRFAAALAIVTGRASLAAYRQELLIELPADQPVPPDVAKLMTSLWRAQRWTAALAFTAAELAALREHPAAFGITDPAAPSVAGLRSLAGYRDLTTRFADTQDRLAGYLTGSGTGQAGQLAELTGWDREQIAALIAALWPVGDDAVAPAIRSVAAVTMLDGCFALAARVSSDTGSLLGLGDLASLPADAGWAAYQAAAGATLGMLGAHFGAERAGGEFAAYADANDTAYRDVLLRYVIWLLAKDDASITGPADLYSRLLVDVEMSACDVTTRMAQAINSVQLYLQRCRLGLEPGVDNLRGIEPRWWEWMSTYRVWEANRKVFLYPENYLDPTLRRGTSAEFTELKQSLMQTRVTQASATAAYSGYFQGLADLAALVPCAAFKDITPSFDASERRSTLYLLARTRTAPYTYYYLTRRDGGAWTPWRKIDLTINSAFVTPIVAFDKLFIFWSEMDAIKSSSVSMSGGTAATETRTISSASLKYAFQTLTGDWTSPQTLAEKIPVRVLPQPYDTFKKEENERLVALFDPSNLFWLQPQVAKVSRGLRGRAKARPYNVPDGDPVAGLGAITITAGSATVTGTGTEFLTQLRPGYRLVTPDGERQIVAIAGPAGLTVDQPLTTSAQNVQFSFVICTGKVAGGLGKWDTRTSFTSQVAAGDFISCDAQLGVVVKVNSDTELTMLHPWAWASDAGEYKIIPSDPLQTSFRPFEGTGTLKVSHTLRSVEGSRTLFLQTVSVGDRIFAAGQTRTVIGLGSDTELVVDRPWPHSIPVVPYTIVPQESGAESLFVQLGPPVDVTNSFIFDVWKPAPNLGDDPYIEALNRLNGRVSDALTYCLQIKDVIKAGQVGAGAGFLLDAELNLRDARLFFAPDDRPVPNSPGPYAEAIDRGNSTLVAATVPGSVGWEYWLNYAAGRKTPVAPAPNSVPVEMLYNVSASPGMYNVGNVTGAVLYDNGDEAFLLEAEEAGTWPAADRLTVIPYQLTPDRAGDYRVDTGPYAPRPLGVDGALFGVTRLTTSTIGALARRLSALGVPGLLTPESQRTPEIPFSRFYRTINSGPPAALDPMRLPPDRLSFTGPFGLYQREIFFHTPYLVAGLLTANARYDEARAWYQYIFDPTAEPDPDGSGTSRFWRYLPFRDITVPTLLAVLTDPAGVRAYNDDPLDPFAIAEVRTSAYAKAVVMRYVENLIAWGDSLFAQDTRESVSQAANLYVMAAELLGPRPRKLGDVPAPPAKTFGQIRDEYRARKENIPQFLIDLEHTPLGRLGPAEQRYVSTPINDIDAYFCVPANSALDGCWALIEDRLDKIRTCQNLQGVTRALAPFAPPLDIRAAITGAAGGGGHGPQIPVAVPNYRFTTLIDQARQLTSQVTGFGAQLLAALDRRDAEELALLQNQQQRVILDLTTSIRRDQVDQLLVTGDVLAQTLAAARYRQAYYSGLAAAGLIPAEVENMRASEAALIFNVLALTIQAAAAVAFALPNVGSPFAMTYGGIQIGSALQGASAVYQIGSVVSGFAAERALLMANYERRAIDWQFQANLAGYDVRQTQAQIDANQLAIDAAKQEYAVHVRTIEQNAEIERFLRGKFTSAELYGWLIGRLSSLYYQLYTLAYTTARQAERAYQLETGSSRQFISPAFWDDARRGLLAGEGLTLAIGQLQQAYLAEYVRAYEIERTVSLLTQDPRAIMQLRRTGECVFDLPERMYDQDYPGHYRRVLSSVTVTVPALVGPYQSIRGTLTQLGSQIVLAPSPKTVAYLLGDTSVPTPGPDLLRSNPRVAQSIAISTGVDDDGVFDASLTDGRYLPFERTGAVSQWRLRIPLASNQIDFDAISDVVLTVRYTALDGGDKLRAEVQKLLPDYRGRTFVSLAQQYSAGWYAFLAEPTIDGGVQVLPFRLPRTLLPPHVDPASARATSVYLAVETPVPFEPGSPFVTLTLAAGRLPEPVTFRGRYAGAIDFAPGSGPLLRDIVASAQTLGFNLAAAPAGFTVGDRSRLREDAVRDVQLVIDIEGPVTWPPAS